ncbi:alpha/beta hydrolase [Yinghuangia aomiensis]
MTDCVVISVDYRLAPEFAYPVPLEDAVAAWVWVQERAFSLGVNPDKVSIGGDSAGGNLAAAATLALRDRRIPMPVAQVLEVPALDLTLGQPSVKENGTGYLLTEEAHAAGRRALHRQARRRDGPVRVPAACRVAARAPQALVMTCEYDPLRDEGEAYAKRLAEAGVPVEVKRWDGPTHGAGMYTALLEDAGRSGRRSWTSCEACTRSDGAAPHPPLRGCGAFPVSVSRSPVSGPRSPVPGLRLQPSGGVCGTAPESCSSGRPRR